MSAVLSILDDLALEFVVKYPEDAARALQDLDADDAAAMVARCRPVDAARLVGRLGPDAASRVLARLPAGATHAVLAHADPEVTTALLRRLPGQVDLAAVLAGLPAARRHEVQSLLSYPENSAGSLMDPAAPVFREDTRVAEVAAALVESRRYSDQTVTVIDANGRLLGTLPTVQVLLADPDARLTALGVQDTLSVEGFAHRDEVADLIEQRRLSAIPVIDVNRQPVGLLNQRALARVAEQDVVSDMQSMVGASRDEQALSTVGFAVRKRLPWLQINLATAFLAAAVVGIFEDTIAQFTALAVLLPVVAGQSGNTGAQSLAVTMRGLTLHEIGLRHWLRVVMKESTVGLVNGLAVAVVTMAGVYVWSRSLGLCGVIGLAMVLSMTIAGVAGAGVPLVLRASGQDPAQSSSIILTTVTDISGFFSFLGLAALFASWL
jgi:magnesium transporter